MGHIILPKLPDIILVSWPGNFYICICRKNCLKKSGFGSYMFFKIEYVRTKSFHMQAFTTISQKHRHMKKCPKCKNKISFRDHLKNFFHDPSNYYWKCDNCGSYLKTKGKSRLITIILSLPLAFFIFSKQYGLHYFIDNLAILILIFLSGELILLYFEKTEIIQKDLIIENLKTGRKEYVSNEDWELIKANKGEENYRIINKIENENN